MNFQGFSYIPDQNVAPGAAAFGMTSQEQVAELNKALAIDYSHPPTNFSASPLRSYSIDGTLKSVSYTQKHIVLWNRTEKVPAYSTVEEYSKLINYGPTTTGAFTNAGALPEAHDSSYVRENKNVKYVGTQRAVQHPATLVRTAPVIDLIAQETINGTVYLLGVIESSLFNGNSSLITQEWDGLFTEVKAFFASNPLSDTVIDVKGAALAKQDLTDAANTVLNAYGVPTSLYVDLLTKGDLDQLYLNNVRYNDPTGAGGVGGSPMGSHAFQPGQMFNFIPNVFLKPGGAPPSSAAPKAPAAPSFSSAAASDSSSTLATGTYRYQVTSVNQYGESLPSAAGNQAITAGQKCTLTITIGSPNSYDAVAFKIYRIDAATGTPTFLKMIAASTATTGTFVDLGAVIAGTSKAILLMEDTTNFVFKQLAPFTKIPLATIDASIRWMQLLYGVPILFTPGKNVVFENIGRRAGSLV